MPDRFVIRGPLPDVPLIPTNGPTAETLGEYMAAGAVALGVGRDLFPDGYTLDGVEAACRKLVAAMREFRTTER